MSGTFQGNSGKSSSYSKQTQDLLKSVQKSSHIINSIKNGKNLLSSQAQKRVVSGNMNYRKSLGGPVVAALQGSVLKPPSQHVQQPSLILGAKHRPQTSGAPVKGK